MPLNVHPPAHATPLRADADMWEICNADKDIRVYQVEVTVGRYGPGSIDPEARLVVWEARGPYIAGLELGDVAWQIFRVVARLIPEPGDSTDPLYHRGGPSNRELAENIRRVLFVEVDPDV